MDQSGKNPDRKKKSRREHGYLSLVSVVCCQVEDILYYHSKNEPNPQSNVTILATHSFGGFLQPHYFHLQQ
jgi:hypothetical protein